MRLESERLLIKDLDLTYKNELMEIIGNSSTLPDELFSQGECLERIANRLVTDGSYYGIWEKSSRRLVGFLCIHYIALREQEIGIMLGKDSRGRGYAYEAVNTYWEYHIQNFKCSLYALCLEGNMRGIESLLRNGFTPVRTIRAGFRKDGQFYNVVRFEKKYRTNCEYDYRW